MIGLCLPRTVPARLQLLILDVRCMSPLLLSRCEAEAHTPPHPPLRKVFDALVVARDKPAVGVPSGAWVASVWCNEPDWAVFAVTLGDDMEHGR